MAVVGTEGLKNLIISRYFEFIWGEFVYFGSIFQGVNEYPSGHAAFLSKEQLAESISEERQKSTSQLSFSVT